MDEQKRLLIAIALIAGVFVTMQLLWPSQPQRQGPTRNRQNDRVTAPEKRPQADGDEPVAEPAPQPSERHVMRPERRVRLSTKALLVEVVTRGGGITRAVLRGDQFREGRGPRAPQINLVSVNVAERPELTPFAFSLLRKRTVAPSATETAEGQGVLALVNDRAVSAEALALAADIDENVASKIIGGRTFSGLEGVGTAIGGHAAQRREVLGKLLAAAWQRGLVRLDFEVAEASASRIVLRGETDDQIAVTRTIRVVSDYEVRITDRLRNQSKARREVRDRLAVTGLEKSSGGGFLSGRPTGLVRGLCLHGDDMIRRDRGRLSGEGGGCMPMPSCSGGPAGPVSRTGEIRFAAVDRHYFMAAVTPSASWADTTCTMAADREGLIEVAIEASVPTELEPGGETSYSATAYFGPKQYDLLRQLGPGRRLWEAIDYGWFAFLSHWLLAALQLFYGWFHNWGLAIIVLTILIKTLLLPITHWAMKSGREMQAKMALLKPEIDAINERYKDQPELKSQKTMELWQQRGINPLRQVGCIPMFLQMPIWIALYRMIAESVELYRAPFVLWLTDLSAHDPYYILPGLLGLATFLQMRMTPQPGVEAAQAKMMRWMMPAMFLFIMVNMPAGLVLYIFVNTLLTMVQQQFINRLVPAVEPLARAKGGARATDREQVQAGDGGSAQSKGRSRRRKRK